VPGTSYYSRPCSAPLGESYNFFSAPSSPPHVIIYIKPGRKSDLPGIFFLISKIFAFKTVFISTSQIYGLQKNKKETGTPLCRFPKYNAKLFLWLKGFALCLIRSAGVTGMIPVNLDHGCRTFHGLVEVALCNITFNIGHFFTSVHYGNPKKNIYANIYRLISFKSHFKREKTLSEGYPVLEQKY